MRLQTRILLASGFYRYAGTAVLMLVGFALHPVHYFLGAAWLIGCRSVLHRWLLPPLFARTTCRNCRNVIVLRQRWKCGSHYTDHKERHALAFHCNRGHELASFDCPVEDCGATIQIQKGNRKRLERGKVVDGFVTPVHASTDRRRLPRLSCLWCRQKSIGLLVGHDRRRDVGIWGRLTRTGRHTKSEVRIGDDVMARHAALLGGTGMGKSTMIVNLARQLFARGEGATFLDPTGDLASDLLRQVPPDRINDVLYIDVSDRHFPFPFNLLHANDELERGQVVDELIGVIRRLSQNWGDTIAHQLRMALHVVLEIDGSLQDVYDLFTNAEARHRIVRKVKDEELKEYWTETFPSSRYERRSAVITKLAPIVDHKLLGPVLCARDCAFDADEIIRKRKIVIVNLATGSPADHVPTILGTFIVNKLLAAVYRQKNVPFDERIRHFFMVDEFQNFMHRAQAFDRILSEVRKFKLTLCVANQTIAQLDDKIRSAIFGNVGVLSVFRVGHQDARALRDEFDGASKRDLTLLGRGQCLVRVGTHWAAVRTLPPPKPPVEDPTEVIIANMHAMIDELRDDRTQADNASTATHKRTVSQNEDPRPNVLCEFA